MAIALTQKTVKMLGGVVLAAVAIGAAYFLDYPLLDEYKAAQSSVSDAQTQIDTMQASVNKLKQSKDNFDKIEQIDQDLKTRFPQEMLTRDVLQSLFVTMAQESGINLADVQSIQFDPPSIQKPDGSALDPTATADASALAGTFATMKISISLSGKPQNLMRYLYALNNMDRAIIISSISFSPSSSTTCNDSCLTLSFSGLIFIYPAIEVPTAISADQTQDGSSPTGTPTDAPTSAPTDNPTGEPTDIPSSTPTPTGTATP